MSHRSTERSTEQAERRRKPRSEPAQLIRVTRTRPVVPLADAQVINVSQDGVAITTSVPVAPGDRLSFYVQEGAPPILANVLACDRVESGYYIVRCRCLLGGFAT